MIKRLLLTAALAILTLPSSAQDGSAILKKVISAYASLNSYSQVSSAMETFTSPRFQDTIGSSAKLRYRKPDRFYVVLTGARVGTSVAVSNGQQETIYSSQVDKYRRLPAPKNISAFVNSLLLLGLHANMDPLDFLRGVPEVSKLGRFKFLGGGMVNGVKCLRISATMGSSTLPKGGSGSVTLWVDSKSSLLHKVEWNIKGVSHMAPVQVMKKGKPTRVLVKTIGVENLVETIQEMHLNPILHDSDFQYPLPATAVEQKINP